MSAYILAHDLGTTGNKATLYDTDGRRVAGTLAEYPTHYPRDGWVEQAPQDWWRAVCVSTQALLAQSGVNPADVLCVSFSGIMMGCLLVDAQGEPLHPMLIWADTRATAQEAEMIQRAGMARVYHITGHRASASYAAAKLLWLREHRPDAYRRAHKMLSAKDYIVHQLTGRFVTDYSDASGTNLLDINTLRWSDELLTALAIDPALMPEVLPSTTVVGTVCAQAARACGLLQGTPVVLGGGDGSCACVGAGVVREGSAYNVLGSSSWISMAARKPLYDEAMRTFNWVHLDASLVTPCGTMQAAGYSYRWFRDALGDGLDYEALNALAEASPPGARGMLFLPYLLGERSPRWNLDARGAFVGLGVSATKGDMARAVLEGVGLNLKIILDILHGAVPIEAITVIGGGAKGRLWLQILADIWQRPVHCVRFPDEATSAGAAVCGGVGIGALEGFQAVARFNQPSDTLRPNPALAQPYARLALAFEKAYEGLRAADALLAQDRQ